MKGKKKKESKRGGWSHSVLRVSPIFHEEGTIHLGSIQLQFSHAAVCAPFQSAWLCCFGVTPASHVGSKEGPKPPRLMVWRDRGREFFTSGSACLSRLLFSSQAGGL